MKKKTESTTQYLSLLFFLLTFLCYTNSLHGIDQLPKININLSIIHLATAIGFLVIGRVSTEASIYFIRSFGLAYLLISFVGFHLFQGTMIDSNNQWSHVFSLNMMNYIHFALGVTLSFTGSVLNDQKFQRIKQ